MKAFVIKNKEGKYHKRGFPCWENIERDGVFNTGHFYYENKEEAESCIASYGLKDCEVVKITIAEGDLETYIDKLQEERDFEVRDKTLIVKQLNDPNQYVNRKDYIKLEQQLAEKDKEIERLKEELAENEHIIDFHMKNNIYNVALKDYSVLAPYPKNMVQIIRHQVCDEIRQQSESWNEDENGNIWQYHILESQLQEIEQAKGEKDE